MQMQKQYQYYHPQFYKTEEITYVNNEPTKSQGLSICIHIYNQNTHMHKEMFL